MKILKKILIIITLFTIGVFWFTYPLDNINARSLFLDIIIFVFGGSLIGISIYLLFEFLDNQENKNTLKRFFNKIWD